MRASFSGSLGRLSSARGPPGRQLQADEHKFAGPDRSEMHEDVDDAIVHVLRRGRRGIADYPIGLRRSRPEERSLREQLVQEAVHAEPYARPQGLAIGLERRPLQTVGQALLDKQ